MLGTPADMAEAARWLDLPGLTETAILDEVARVIRGKRDGPPSNFKYFTRAVTALSGALSAPPLQPDLTPRMESPYGRPRKPSGRDAETLARIAEAAIRQRAAEREAAEREAGD